MIKSIKQHFAILAIVQLLTFLPLSGQSAEEVFTNIYKTGLWGRNNSGMGTSGDGSTLHTTEDYRKFLQQFLKDMHIQSVVDAGCGDWGFSYAVNWDGIDYCGYDVVQPVIQANQSKFGKENIRFMHADLINAQLPEADLLICKDVLQHLTNEDVFKFISQFPKYKYCLITNDVDPHSFTSYNSPIGRGDYRTLDLTKPPFSVFGYKVLTYSTGCVKQVLLIIRP